MGLHLGWTTMPQLGISLSGINKQAYLGHLTGRFINQFSLPDREIQNEYDVGNVCMIHRLRVCGLVVCGEKVTDHTVRN